MVRVFSSECIIICLLAIIQEPSRVVVLLFKQILRSKMDHLKRAGNCTDGELTSSGIERHPIAERNDFAGPPAYSAGIQLDTSTLPWGPEYYHGAHGASTSIGGPYEWMQHGAQVPMQSGILPQRSYHTGYHQPYPDPHFTASYPQYDNERCLAPASWSQRNGHQELAPRILPRRSRRMQFPEKLMHALVHFPNEEALTWTPSGDAFVILNPDLFVTAILSKVSKTTIKYPSLVRKLLRWGFTRLPSRSGKGCFHHPCFNINFPEKASLVTAVATKLSARSISTSSSESCTPNRYHPPRIEESSNTNQHGHQAWIESSCHAGNKQIPSLPQSSSVRSTSKEALPTPLVMPIDRPSTSDLVRSQDCGDQSNTTDGPTNCQTANDSLTPQVFAHADAQASCYPRAEAKGADDIRSDKDTESPPLFTPSQYRSVQVPEDSSLKHPHDRVIRFTFG